MVKDSLQCLAGLSNVVSNAIDQGSRVFAFRVVSHWETSVIAHPLVLPLKVCEELQRVINHSHSELPSSMRSMRSYQVRCLRSPQLMRGFIVPPFSAYYVIKIKGD